MTWNDAAEDAIGLDDDALIEACLGLDTGKASRDTSTTLPDWPPRSDPAILISIDPATAAWFQARSKAWRRDIGRVLRAWIVAHEPSNEPAADSPTP